tara:strand:- start:904 stop:2475 length:1572 start_codon:yes stop_codon:yes gene_type:complete
MNILNSNQKTTKIDNKTKISNNMSLSNNMSKLIYDIKGKNLEGVTMDFKDMTDKDIEALMKTERFSLTCAPGGENNRGMEIIGRMPIKGEGFTAQDIEELAPYFRKLMNGDMKENMEKVSMLNLNKISDDKTIEKLSIDDQGRVLVLRDWASKTMGADGWTKEVFKELASKRWDAEYLDPNKYRTEIKDGKEVKVRGKRMNKLARTNLCFVAGREQEPAVYEGKGTIYDLKKMEYLNKGVERLRQQIADGLIYIGSKTKVEINVVEGNRYYNLKNTGIGFHGDTERVVVICISIGCDNYPMRWQWFKDGMPVGKSIDINLNCGDVYIMSEKAVGADWKKKSIYTLRHSAGAKKYTSLDRWEKKRPAYEAKLKEKAEKKEKQLAVAKAKADKRRKEYNERKAKKEAEKKAKEEAKKNKVKLNDIKNKGKTTKKGNLKVVDPEKEALKKYKKALKKHDWEDSDAGFYRWIAIEAEHMSSPSHFYFKEFQAIWSGKAENYAKKMDISIWEKHRKFYKNLCLYSMIM